MTDYCDHATGVTMTSWPFVCCLECGASGKVKDGSPFPPNSTRDVQWEMTYEQFVAKMQEHEDRLWPDNFFGDEMKEVFRWATQNHFDHFWRYTTGKGLTPEQQAKLDALVKDFGAEPL